MEALKSYPLCRPRDTGSRTPPPTARWSRASKRATKGGRACDDSDSVTEDAGSDSGGMRTASEAAYDSEYEMLGAGDRDHSPQVTALFTFLPWPQAGADNCTSH